MQIGRPKFPLNLSLEQLGARRPNVMPKQRLRNMLLGSLHPAEFQARQNGLSAAARFNIAAASRTELYRDVATRLGELGSGTETPSLTQTVTRTESAVAGGPNSLLSSGEALNIGTTTAPSINPNGKLADQPFLTPITAGSLDLRFEVDGEIVNHSVMIDPANQSLQDVLDTINTVKTSTGRSFMFARFDAGTGEVVFDLTSQEASRAVDLAGNAIEASFEVLSSSTSNVFDAISNGGKTSTLQVSSGQLVSNPKKSTQTDYTSLDITYGGATLLISGIKTSATSDLTTRVNEIVAKINGDLATYNATATDRIDLIASNVGNRLVFTDASGNAPMSLRLKEVGLNTSRGVGAGITLALGVESTDALAPTTTTLQLRGKPAIDPNAVPPVVGPDASLARLAGQLGLTPSANGTYAMSINGTRLEFQQSESLLGVLEAINRSDAKVEASYDALSQRVVLRHREAGKNAIEAQDTEGNLLAALKLTQDKALFVEGAPAQAAATSSTTTEVSTEGVENLRRLGEGLAEIHGLLSAATGKNGPFGDDQLLTDLRDALSGTFLDRGAGELSSLGSLGLSLSPNGELALDEERLRTLLAERPAEVSSFVKGFIEERVRPLARSGSHALQDALANAPFEQRLAAQSVHVRGEMSRLQARQMLVLMTQVNLQEQQKSIKEQDQRVKETEQSLLKADKLQPKEPAAELKTAPTPPITPATSAPASPGLLSFGLSS